MSVTHEAEAESRELAREKVAAEFVDDFGVKLVNCYRPAEAPVAGAGCCNF